MKNGAILPTNIALIGYGYWGKKVYSTLLNLFKAEQVLVVDPFAKQTANVHFATFEKMLMSKTSHVFVATPEETHYDLALKCLEAKKNVFVEKPLCLKLSHAKKLQTTAKKNGLKLFVDYTFLFDAAVNKISELIKSNKIGKLYQIDSIRHSININKPNVSVFDDLATHDLYLGRFFFGDDPEEVSAQAETMINNQISQSSGQISYKVGKINFHYSWIQPTATRKMTFFGTEATLIWDRLSADLLIYKNQTLVERIAIDTGSDSPLLKSIMLFFEKEKNQNYLPDIKNIELLDKTKP